jgi:hypothetical protein
MFRLRTFRKGKDPDQSVPYNSLIQHFADRNCAAIERLVTVYRENGFLEVSNFLGLFQYGVRTVSNQIDRAYCYSPVPGPLHCYQPSRGKSSTGERKTRLFLGQKK